jgi:outer membrane protein OmpA-like peptidoglycan-associated protein
MGKKISYLLGILLTLILGTILYYYLCCCQCNNTKNTVTETETNISKPEIKEATPIPFSITDPSSKMTFNANENFNFSASNFSLLTPISSDLDQEILKVTNYLKDNPNKYIDIKGLYTNSEKNNSVYPNLGLARANSVKNYFISKGLSSKYMNTSGVLDDTLVPNEKNVYLGPLKYVINTIDENDTTATDALKKLGQEIKDDPLMMHFEIGNTAINLSAEQRQKIANISRYIDKVDTAFIQITGHTDNTGDRASNIVLGKNRANFAKDHFVKNGIRESKIKVFSKGPDEPIADNKTEEGRSENRRVIVTIN